MNIYRTLAMFSLAGIICCSGCHDVKGRWRLREMQPALGYEDYTVTKAAFYPNGSFETVALKDGQMIRAKGTYDYHPCKRELTLITGEKVLTYQAHTEECGRELHVTKIGPDDMPTTAVMVRHFKCPYCSNCSQCAKRCARCP